MSEPQMAQCQSMHTVGFNSANLTTDAVLHEVGEESAGNAILHETESAGKEKGRRRGKGQIQEKKERERTRNGKGKDKERKGKGKVTERREERRGEERRGEERRGEERRGTMKDTKGKEGKREAVLVFACRVLFLGWEKKSFGMRHL